MTYLSKESKVIYESKDGKQEKVFDALDWLAAMTPHVPNKVKNRAQVFLRRKIMNCFFHKATLM
jgi:hypothetical protein